MNTRILEDIIHRAKIRQSFFLVGSLEHDAWESTILALQEIILAADIALNDSPPQSIVRPRLTPNP